MTQQSIYRKDANWQAGYNARLSNEPVDACKAPLGTIAANRWIDGWNDANKELEASANAA